MKYNFDERIERRGTDCLKYDFAARRGKPEDVLPLWVADMDFQTAKPIRDAVIRTAEHGIYGYTETGDAYFAAVRDWYKTRFGYTMERRWLVKTPGVVYAIAQAIRAFTKENESVLLMQPVYYPFAETIADNKRRLVNCPLVLRDGRYEIDFTAFEDKIERENVRLFLLCSPHNPVGRVWTREELTRLVDICARHGVLIVSDEIHSDFVYEGHTHTMTASVSPQAEAITITCTAPSKTFNLAGLQVSNIFIADDALRRRFREAIAQTGYSQLNTVGLAACFAAYTEGAEWLLQLKEYLRENLSYTRAFFAERLPKLRLIEPEGTYLLWVDCRGLLLSPAKLDRFIVHNARLWLDDGAIFGKDGEGFERFNIACPRSVLTEAYTRLANAAEAL